MPAWYNEVDAYAAEWLRNLIAAGHIATGDVDERSILDVRPGDLVGYDQCHFFAGIGGWSHALRLAGWPDDRPVWTGSCPCQPLSSAGQRKGHADERHLWPAFYALIAECKPPTVFGEQVAGKDGFEWLAGVRADLEASGYACGAADLCAAGAGAPHIRQRLFWVAQSEHERHTRGLQAPSRAPGWWATELGVGSGATGGLGNAAFGGERPLNGQSRADERAQEQIGGHGLPGGLGNADPARLPAPECDTLGGAWRREEGRATGEPGGSFWSDAVWLRCLDGKARRIEPAIFPLASGIPNRMGLLRGAGNSIVPQVAAEFVMAFMESEDWI